jgi:hypothetical protein
MLNNVRLSFGEENRIKLEGFDSLADLVNQVFGVWRPDRSCETWSFNEMNLLLVEIALFDST